MNDPLYRDALRRMNDHWHWIVRALVNMQVVGSDPLEHFIVWTSKDAPWSADVSADEKLSLPDGSWLAHAERKHARHLFGTGQSAQRIESWDATDQFPVAMVSLHRSREIGSAKTSDRAVIRTFGVPLIRAGRLFVTLPDMEVTP